jgi:hypothetical protein
MVAKEGPKVEAAKRELQVVLALITKGQVN